MRVVSLNIWHDQDNWPARQTLIIEGLRDVDADVVCLQEVLQHATLPNQAQTIADSLGYHYYFTSVDSAGRERRYGNAILTRAAIEDSSWHALNPLDDYRNAGHIRTTVKNRSVDVYCTHLHHTATPEGEAIRREQLGDLLSFIDRTRSAEDLVLAGDFNANPDFPELQAVTERFDDTFALVHGYSPRPTTLNIHLGHEDRWIDYVFIEKDGALRATDVQRILDEERDGVWPSDHFGVMADLAFVERPVDE